MKVSNCKQYSVGFAAQSAQSPENVKTTKKKGLLDNFETQIRNTSDLNDVIKVPRTIFKGYLAIMISSTMVALASFAKDKSKPIPKTTNIAAAILGLWGAYSFVKPYLVRDLSEKQ